MSLDQEFREGFLSVDTELGSQQSAGSRPRFPPPASHLTLLTDFIDTFFKEQKQNSAQWV